MGGGGNGHTHFRSILPESRIYTKKRQAGKKKKKQQHTLLEEGGGGGGGSCPNKKNPVEKKNCDEPKENCPKFRPNIARGLALFQTFIYLFFFGGGGGTVPPLHMPMRGSYGIYVLLWGLRSTLFRENHFALFFTWLYVKVWPRYFTSEIFSSFQKFTDQKEVYCISISTYSQNYKSAREFEGPGVLTDRGCQQVAIVLTCGGFSEIYKRIIPVEGVFQAY